MPSLRGVGYPAQGSTKHPIDLYINSEYRNAMTPNLAVATILVVGAVSMSGIWLTANWAERKIKRIIRNAEPANIITGCTFVAAKDSEEGWVMNTKWKTDV